MYYSIEIAGVKRDLPICKVFEDLYIAAFIILGDAELTEVCAKALLEKIDMENFDYMMTAEAKSIPLIHEMARQSGASKYIVARKGAKTYMQNPICVEDESITTAGKQKLYLGADDVSLIQGKRILLVDDVISTGGTIFALEKLVQMAGGTVTGRAAILAEGDAQNRNDIQYLAPLPLFHADGTMMKSSI